MAWMRTRVAVLGLAADLYGESVVVRRGGEGFTSTVRDVEPLVGVAAARQVRDQAIQRMREYALVARGEGSSWAEVAEWLDVVDENEGEWVREPRSPGEVAFEFVAAGSCPAGLDRWVWSWAGSPSARWTCGCCGCPISDRGPGEPDPRQGEQGHAVDCARWGKAVAAYDRERDGAGEFTDV